MQGSAPNVDLELEIAQLKLQLQLSKMELEVQKKNIQQFRFLLDNLNDGVLISKIDEAGKISHFIEINEAACQQFGYSKKELLNLSLVDIYADDKEHDNLIIDKILKNKDSIFEIPFNLKNGGTKDFEMSSHVYIENGEQLILSVSRDITYRKKAESSLHKSEERYRMLFNSGNDAVLVHEVSKAGIPGYFIEVNDIACKRLGYKREELMKMTSLDIEAPETLYMIPEIIKDLIKDKYGIWEGIHVRKNGQYIPVEISTHVFDVDGQQLFISNVRDVTERKNAEKDIRESRNKYRTIFDQSPIAIEFYDTKGLLVNVNQACIEMFSIGNVPFVLGYSLFDDPGLSELDKKLLLQGKAVRVESEFRMESARHLRLYETAAPGVVVLDMIVVPLLTEENEDYGYVVQVQNITERKRIENELRENENKLRQQNEEYLALNEELCESNNRISGMNEDLLIAKEKAEESDRLKSAFLANMSHEIRTPMNGIVGFSELLTKEGLDEKIRHRYSETVKQSCQRLLGIINDIIDIAKIEAGQISINKNKINVNNFLNDCYAFYKPLANAKNIDLQLHIGLPVPAPMILSDETKLAQILNNLIDNAIKFTSKGSVEIGYIIMGSEIEFFVKDSGIGIDATKHAVIFDRFRQAELNTSQTYGGTGLGLAITKTFVTLLGGKIWVSSKLGEGTIFYFTIPLGNLLKTSEKPEIKTKIVEIAESSKKTILIAEDEETNYSYLKELLGIFGFQILWAKNGKEAVAFVESGVPISLILMDLKMPGMGGIEATRIIKSMQPNIPIIAQTAYAFSEDRINALEAGCEEYISKPIKQNDLLVLINRLV